MKELTKFYLPAVCPKMKIGITYRILKWAQVKNPLKVISNDFRDLSK